MNIFGLSSVDALISILLVETGWWGREFFENFLPLLFQNFQLNHNQPLIIASTFFLLKFLIQGVLWYAFLRNEVNKHGLLLKGWCGSGIILDFLFSGLILYFFFTESDSDYTILYNLIPFVTFRVGIWTLAIRLISDLSHKDKHFLFPVGFVDHVSDHLRTESTLVLVLTWEFIWNCILNTGIIFSILFHHWDVILPHPKILTPLNQVILTLEVPISLFLLIGILRRWKFCRKFGLSFYVVVNVFGYALICYLDILQAYAMGSYEHFNLLHRLTTLGTKIILPLFALGLKLSVVFGSLNLICKPEGLHEHDHEIASEDKPLIHARIH